MNAPEDRLGSNSVVPVMSAARPLFPRKRKSIRDLAMSHSCHDRTHALQQNSVVIRSSRPRERAPAIRLSKDYGTSRDHSGFAPENLTTLPHLSISSATSFPKSAGEPGMTVPPSSARRALTAPSAKPAFISVLSLSIMWLG